MEAAGWQVRTERFPSGRYGIRTWERRSLLRGADVVRVHDVAEAVRAVRVADAVVRGTPAAVAALPRPGPTG